MLGHPYADLLAISGIVLQAPQSTPGWQFHSTFGYCLAQQLSSPHQGIRIVRTPASDDTQIVIFDEARWGDQPDVDLEGATVRVGGSDAFTSRARAGRQESPANRFVSVLAIDPQFLSRFSTASNVSVSHRKFGTMSASVQSSALAVTKLRDCEDKKMAKWGIDPAAWHSLRSPPRPLADFRSWIVPESQNVPGTSEGQAVLRLTISPNGRVAECRYLDPSIASELDEAACRGLSIRGRFAPAYDTSGNPVAAPYVVVAEFTRS